MVKTLPEFEYFFTEFLNNRNFFFQNENIKSNRLCSFKYQLCVLIRVGLFIENCFNIIEIFDRHNSTKSKRV